MPKDHLLYLALVQEGLAVPQQQQQQPPAAAAAVRSNVFTPSYPDPDTLSLAHDRTYVDSFLSGSISAADMRRIGLPWSEQLVQRTLVGTGSAVLAARLALSYGVAIMCNGGTHHAHRAHGSGKRWWCGGGGGGGGAPPPNNYHNTCLLPHQQEWHCQPGQEPTARDRSQSQKGTPPAAEASTKYQLSTRWCSETCQQYQVQLLPQVQAEPNCSKVQNARAATIC
jgi:hypothetical protein